MSVAFFDVDGTLLPHPSLERRFFWHLFRRGKIPAANYLRWIAQMLRMGATNLKTAAQSNKMYLSLIPASVLSQPEFRNGRCIPEFFPPAVQRVWWHALRGDRIVLVTGSPAPLAEIVKAALERELLWRGIETQVAVIATRLVTRNGRWSGDVEGVPMFGEAKAAAAKDFANSYGVPPSQCFAYGDQSLDRPMLEAVGNPFVINPSPGLRRVARQKKWHVMTWTPPPQRTANTGQGLQCKGEVAR
jgi:HAD superfamily hydrolase (TIGR01490 family)